MDKGHRKWGTYVATDGGFFWYIYARYDWSAKNAWQQMEEYVDDYANQGVTDLSFNIFEQASLTPSQVWTWRGSKYGQTEENGIAVNYRDEPHVKACWDYYTGGDCDPLEILIAHTRKRGMNAWLTFRMNDSHYHGESTAFLRGEEFYRFYNEKRMVFGHTNGYFDTCFNFDDQQVRQHYLAYLEEQILRYDCDGVDLDFMRDIFCFEYWEKETEYYCEIMTDFISNVRDITKKAEEKFGHSIKLLVRVTRDVEQSRIYGFDAKAWIEKGIVDVIVPSPRWGSTDSAIPFADWVALTEGTDVEIYAGQELWLAIDMYDNPYQNTASVKGFAAAAYSQGVSKIYLSNYFTTKDIRHYDAWKEISTPENVYSGTRRHIVTYQENDMIPKGSVGYRPLPCSFEKEYAIKMYTGQIKNTDKLTVFCDFALSGEEIPEVTVGGVAATLSEQTEGAYYQVPKGKTLVYTLTGGAGETEQTVCFRVKNAATLYHLEILVESGKG